MCMNLFQLFKKRNMEIFLREGNQPQKILCTFTFRKDVCILYIFVKFLESVYNKVIAMEWGGRWGLTMGWASV